MEVKTVGYSIANNIIPSLRFSRESKEKEKEKEVILILGRQHPCETVGSFLAEEIMKFLMNKNGVTDFMFENFDVIVVPMVNPDGVIHGSSRCNMAGLDLNRQWGDQIMKVLVLKCSN